MWWRLEVQESRLSGWCSEAPGPTKKPRPETGLFGALGWKDSILGSNQNRYASFVLDGRFGRWNLDVDTELLRGLDPEVHLVRATRFCTVEEGFAFRIQDFKLYVAQHGVAANGQPVVGAAEERQQQFCLVSWDQDGTVVVLIQGVAVHDGQAVLLRERPALRRSGLGHGGKGHERKAQGEGPGSAGTQGEG